VTLLTYSIRFGEPALELRVDVVRRRQAEGVEDIPGRVNVDPPEPRILQPAGQDQVANPASALGV
jgi:hypothetical protein